MTPFHEAAETASNLIVEGQRESLVLLLKSLMQQRCFQRIIMEPEATTFHFCWSAEGHGYDGSEEFWASLSDLVFSAGALCLGIVQPSAQLVISVMAPGEED